MPKHSILLFAILGLPILIESVCVCSKPYEATLKALNASNEVLQYPLDRTIQCNPVSCTYTFKLDTGISNDYGIGGSFLYDESFFKTKSTVELYDTITDKPYYVFTGTENKTDYSFEILPSAGKELILVYKVDPKEKDVPAFLFTAKVVEKRFVKPTKLIEDSKSVNFEGDIAIILDLSSQNHVLLSQVAIDLITSLDIRSDQGNARVNLFLLTSRSSNSYGWDNDKDFLITMAKNLPKSLGSSGVSISNSNFGKLLNSSFAEAKLERPLVQRVALFVTDNTEQKFDLNDNTGITNLYFEENDIHPILININPLLKAAKSFETLPMLYSGTNSNLIVLYDYVNNQDFIENVLLNSLKLCNFETILADSIQSGLPRVLFPAEDDAGKHYCNNMNAVFYCNVIKPDEPIIIIFNSINLEAREDFIEIYDDKETLKGLFSGHRIRGSYITIEDSSFAKILIETNSNKVYEGFDIVFANSFFNLKSRRFHVILFMMSLVTVIVFSRIALGVAMVVMVNSTAITIEEFKNVSILERILPPQECISNVNFTQSTAPQINTVYNGKLLWSRKVQSTIFAGTFWGSLISIVPGGYLSDHYSPKRLLLTAGLLYTFTSFIFPFLANETSYLIVFGSRVLMGIGEGLVQPSVNKMISNWIPTSDKAVALSVFTTGFQIAPIIGSPVAAFICSSQFGWEGVFYISGSVFALWTLLFLIFIHDKPEQDFRMNEHEKLYLEKHVKTNVNSKQKETMSFSAICNSKVLISILIGTFFYNVYSVFSQLYLPGFFKDNLFLQINTLGIYISIIFLVSAVAKLVYSLGQQFLLKKEVFSITSSIKIAQLNSGILGCIGCLLIPYFLSCTTPLVTVLLVSLSTSAFELQSCGFLTSFLCISPKNIGFLSVINKIVGVIGRIFAPYFITYFTTSQNHSNTLFFILLGTSWLASSILFFYYGTSKIQNYNKPNKNDIEMDMKICESAQMVVLNKKI
uniref:MFS domain-containing protein n=1 Tax=Rhabditophanes sp. KR3021 TaxID=114890 RepID=A0AC35THH2_9BILA